MLKTRCAILCALLSVQGIALTQATPLTNPPLNNSAKPAAPAAVPLNNNAAGNKAADREIYVDVGRASARKLRIAIPAFGFSAPVAGISASDKDLYANKLNDILGFTGAFEAIPASGFLAKGEIPVQPINFDEWAPINTEALILGKLEPAGASSFNLELRLYDIKKKKMLVGKKYSGMQKRHVEGKLRRFADLCMQAFTGELGIFSTKMVFAGARKVGEPKQIYVSNFDGSDMVAITNNNSINMSPSWSPDGSKVTFTSFKEGKAEIYVYNRISKRTDRLTRGPGGHSGASWHPDGRTIAFSGSNAGNTGIYTMNSIDGGGAKPFITGSGLEVEPAYSPDGNKFAFASGRFGNPHLFVRDLVTNSDTRITFAGWYNSSPSWRPDGKKISFAGYDREIDRYDIFLVNPDGRQMERLTLDQGDNEKPSWSPDGRFIAFQSNRLAQGRGKGKGYKLHVMSRDGDNQRALNIPMYDIQMPSWSPRLNEIDEEN